MTNKKNSLKKNLKLKLHLKNKTHNQLNKITNKSYVSLKKN